MEKKEFSRETTFSNDGAECTPYTLSIEQCEKLFKTDIKNGLSSQEAQQRLQQYGANNLGEGSSISIGKILFHQTCNAMIMVLIISMAIALGIQDWISGGVIAFVVLLNVGVGSIQEFKAEQTMGSLRSLSSPTARILRDGNDQTLPAEEVVPGDIVMVKVGDTLPADMRLCDLMNFETDEALLTGESLPIAKDHLAVYHEEIPVGDRLNLGFSSSTVSKGRATGIVVGTAYKTEIGKIAESLQTKSTTIRSVKKQPDGTARKREYTRAFLGTIKDTTGAFLGTTTGTPLHRKLSKLAVYLFFIAVVFAIVVMASQTFIVTRDVAIYAICVALSMIPSSLVVVLTITMAVGAKVMATRSVIIRKLDSLEALGAVNDICSDKTGTLTQGRMIARNVWLPGVGTISVDNSNEAFNPTVGDLGFCAASPLDDSEDSKPFDLQFNGDSQRAELFKEWVTTATLANIATVFQDDQNEWKAHGDPTEIAIQVFAHRVGFPRSSIPYTHKAEFPFDSSIKRMSAIYQDDQQKFNVYTKGAVERVLGCCTKWASPSGKVESLSLEQKLHIEEQMNALSGQGLRVLAFANKLDVEPQSEWNREKIETELTFLGLIGIYDPPRQETAGAVKIAHRAGINVRMATGDHPSTARAIAQEVGILPRNLAHYAEEVVKVMVMTAPEFDALSDDQIDELPVLPLVIARCAPQTKVRLIDALHRRKQFCAMTGDGVNDSPSLKKSDVGIAMGMNGSDVAKDASDIVLSDDNFASILNAVEEGRRMSDNIQKFVLQLLAVNVAQAVFLLVGLVFMDQDGFSVFPLSPVEVLWIIVITSCFPAMGLGVEKAAPDVLQVPPKSAKEAVFTWEMILDMLVYGILMAACCMIPFVIVVYGDGGGELGSECNARASLACHYVYRARSTSFAVMTWCALFLAWEVIDMRRSLFAMKPETETPYTQVFKDLWSNQLLFWSVLGGFISVFVVVYVPVINDKVFLHGAIGYEWGISIAFSVLFVVGCEVWKFCKRVYLRRKDTKVHNPEYDLEKNSPFAKYASFSRAPTGGDVFK